MYMHRYITSAQQHGLIYDIQMQLTPTSARCRLSLQPPVHPCVGYHWHGTGADCLKAMHTWHVSSQKAAGAAGSQHSRCWEPCMFGMKES